MLSDHFSNPGPKGVNQDCVLTCFSGTISMIAIADGIGGKEAGGSASKIAIDILRNEFEKSSDLDLSQAFRLAKQAIEDFSENANIKQMGTTLTACLVYKDKAIVAHVGDTRLYHLRENGIVSKTKDQTEARKLVAEGVLSNKRAAKYHRKNVLLSAVTNYSDYDLYQTEFPVNQYDRLLLLSDGAYDLVSKVEIRDLSVMNKTITDLTSSILNLIKSREIKDDYSLVAAQV